MPNYCFPSAVSRISVIDGVFSRVNDLTVVPGMNTRGDRYIYIFPSLFCILRIFSTDGDLIIPFGDAFGDRGVRKESGLLCIGVLKASRRISNDFGAAIARLLRAVRLLGAYYCILYKK